MESEGPEQRSPSVGETYNEQRDPLFRLLCRWVLHRPEGEPSALYRLFSAGTALILVGCVAAVAVGIKQGQWASESSPGVLDWPSCRAQEQHRNDREERLLRALDASQLRYAALEGALTDPRSPAFAGARRALRLEERSRLEIERDLEGASVMSASQELVGLVSGLALVVAFALLAATLAARHGFRAVGIWGGEEGHSKWGKVYWAWVVIVFLPHVAREIHTSVLATEKSWMAWSSFCISPLAWGCMIATALGVSMVVAYPATILWQFSSRRGLPRSLDLGHPDGCWGVGSYVLFLHTWSIITLLSLLLPCALWLRVLLSERAPLSAAYLVPPAILFICAFAISGRLVLNAIAIRRRYQNELQRLGATWQMIQERNPPPDPTVTFIGEHWWSLPGILIGSLIALQVILEQLGVTDFLFSLSGLR